MKGIVLLSGGLDSTLCLLKLLREGNSIVPMFIDYNQWPLEGELRATVEVVEWSGHIHFKGGKCVFLCPESHLQDLVLVKVSWGEERVGSVWGRTIALVGLAAMWAYTHGNDYNFVALGVHQGDVGPDCDPNTLFFNNLENALSEATKGKFKVELPLFNYTIDDIGKELAKFGIPWDLMYSCYWHPACGYRSPNDSYRCPGCRRKAIAMKTGGAKRKELLLPNCKDITYQSPLAEKVGY